MMCLLEWVMLEDSCDEAIVDRDSTLSEEIKLTHEILAAIASGTVQGSNIKKYATELLQVCQWLSVAVR